MTWIEYESIMHDVTINKRGTITLRVGFLNKLEKKISHANLYFSKKHNALAMDFNIDTYIPSYRFIAHNNNSSPCKYICAALFFRFNNINISKHIGRYIATLEDIPDLGKKMWVIYLKEKNDE